MIVAIYELAREFNWWTWLCSDCVEKWRSRNWQIRTCKQPPHQLTCDDCKRKGEIDG